MKEVLCKQSKETRCYIMSAVMVFEGFNQFDAMTEIGGDMKSEVLGLTKEDMARFSMPTYPQILSHLKSISDSEVRHWIISNTYYPVLTKIYIKRLWEKYQYPWPKDWLKNDSNL